MGHSNELGNEMKKTLDQLTALGGEIRVKLHLASMDARDAWNRLEPRITAAEALAKEATDTSKAALAQLVTDVKKLRDTLAS